MPDIKIAQIGCGYWGRNLLRVFGSTENCELVACCESRESEHATIRRLAPNIEIYSSIQEMFERQNFDAVVIATPADSHYEIAKSALEFEKHVFVEKPLAKTVAEAEELAQLASAKKKTLMVGHTFLYNDAVRWVKEYIDRGELGEVYYAYFQRLSLGKVRQDVNAMWNLAPHDIAIALYWFGEVPVRVDARGISYLQKSVSDINFLDLSFSSGRFAHIHVSWLDPLKTRKAVVVGSEKMIIYDDTAADRRVSVYDKGIEFRSSNQGLTQIPIESFGQFNLIQRAGDILIPHIRFQEPLRREADHFVDCILTGNTPISDAQNGLEVVRVLEQAQACCDQRIGPQSL